jgi:hypothetical protein
MRKVVRLGVLIYIGRLGNALVAIVIDFLLVKIVSHRIDTILTSAFTGIIIAGKSLSKAETSRGATGVGIHTVTANILTRAT